MSFFERVGTALPDDAKSAQQGYGLAAQTAPTPVVPSGMSGFLEKVDGLGLSRWGERSEHFYGVGETKAELPAGVYRCVEMPHIGAALAKQRVETDKLLELPDDAGASVIAEFVDFWDRGAAFRERGFLHKRGYLMWGPPGSGKTSTVQLLIKRLIHDMGGCVLLLDHPLLAALCLQMVRKIETKRPLIAVMEDIDALVQKYGESEYLALLDGEAQVDNICFLATTNYPERLDPRFTDRPSRFDTIREIGMPSAAARRMYLSVKEPGLAEDEVERWVAASEDFSIAHLKEMIVAVKCLGQPLDAVVERLSEQRRARPNSEHGSWRRGAGFLGGARLGNGHAT